MSSVSSRSSQPAPSSKAPLTKQKPAIDPQSSLLSTTENGAAIAMAFPSVASDPTAALPPLRDETSAYPLVAKTCLQLTHFAANGSSAHGEETTAVASSALFHDPSYARILTTALDALIVCMRDHQDRRCRILAAQTLAILARAGYARIRHSPWVFAQREPTLGLLEDQVGSEIPAALAVASLDDPDDGVSAFALQALGRLVLGSSPTSGTLVEDDLAREIAAIAFAKATPYAPTLRAVADEDPSIPSMELQTRVTENILIPRMLQMIDRLLQYPRSDHVIVALPVVVATLVYMVQIVPAQLQGMDPTTYAKRWMEVDAKGLVDTLVQGVLLPAMQSSLDGALASAAALASLRLAHICPQQFWVPQVISATVATLQEELFYKPLQQSLEQRMTTTAVVLIALRAVPFPTRTVTLIALVDIVAELPATIPVPHGVCTPGVLLSWEGYNVYHRPSRMGFWTEIALSFFIDGPVVEGGIAYPRKESLQQFLGSSSFVKVLTDSDNTRTVFARDELLVAFGTVAVETGRRFRVGTDGSSIIVDPNTSSVVEWVKMARRILVAFVPCINLGPKTPYLTEDLSMTSAGLATYARLLQEWLHFSGLIQPATSAALKLTANACPPHLLFDTLAESAAFLSSFPAADMGEMEPSSKLMNEIVVREVKQGIPSHHLRLFVLALAADHWVQSRILSTRKHFESSKKGASSLNLNMQSGRDICAALSPKRMLAKIIQAHVPPVDADGKRKKDPIQKLALETVRVCVACIENIALIACDWLKRIGSSPEAKHLISVSVGLLQGKIDETPLDNTMHGVVGPFCEAAVARIQAFYESDDTGLDQAFPVSELVTQSIKTKIKPLVSSSPQPAGSEEDYLKGYLTQFYRQIVLGRVAQAVYSFPSVGSSLLMARPTNWLRLSIPPIPESKDARALGNVGDTLNASRDLVAASSSPSDATAVVLACIPRRNPRYDGEEEFRLTVVMRAYNITAVEFSRGLRLEFGVTSHEPDPSDLDNITSIDEIRSLTKVEHAGSGEQDSISASAVYRDELKAGEYITWEVSLSPLSDNRSISVVPSVIYRCISSEPLEAGAEWTGCGMAGSGDISTSTGAESKTGEDDFQVTQLDGKPHLQSSKKSEFENVQICGESLVLSPMFGFQPCPLVFFLDRWGDVDTFRFLWFRMLFQAPPIRLKGNPQIFVSTHEKKSLTAKVGALSALTWDGEAIPGGYATKAWAFMTLSGKRILALLTESESKVSSQPELSLHLRADDRLLLFSLVGSKAAQDRVAITLTPGLFPYI